MQLVGPSNTVIRVDSDVLQIASRARSLEERLSGQPEAFDSQSLAPVPGSRIEGAWARWCRAFADGDTVALERRLAWDGLDVRQVRYSLGASLALVSSEAPEWINDLARILELGREVGQELQRGGLSETELYDDSPPPPFLELLVPFLRHARQLLGAERIRWLAPAASAAFERQLLGELATTAARAFYQRFQPERERASDAGVYRAFVSRVLEDGRGLYSEFSVLARQLTRLAVTWARSLGEMLERLEQDQDALSRRLGAGVEGRIAHAEPALSDRHHGGRRVCRLTFVGGSSVVYKPRDVALEAAFQRFLCWLAERGFEPPPPALRIVSRDGYGWVEAVDQKPARCAADVEVYYRQAGALLALAHVLGATDLHMDNVVASAEGPVIVDAETLFQPRRAANRPPSASALERARERLETSVLSTGLLSFFQTDPAGEVYDIGGLSGRGGHRTAAVQRVWRRVNSDDMRPEETPIPGAGVANLLELDGEVQDPQDHASTLIAGCRAMLHFLIDHRETILASGGPLDAFLGRSTRVVLRASGFYSQTLERLTSPSCQRHGLAGSMVIESLARPFRRTRHRPQLWPLLVAERQCLERLDLPRFTLATDSTELSAGGETVRGMYAESGFDAVRERLTQLDEESVRDQVGILEMALQPTEHGSSPGDHVAELPSTPLAPLASADLVWAAERIGRRLADAAIRGDDGSATWISPAVLQLAGRSDRGASYHLYDGSVGIALFLAALHRVTGRPEHAELARAALLPLSRVLESGDAGALLARESLGICSGLGSAVYGLAITGSLLGDDSLLGLAKRAARRITPERIAADRVFDVEGGAAGAILALLALHDLEPRSWLLDRAICCGEHLLATGSPGDSGRGRAWRDADGLQQSGFAHGASGIASALLRLARRTGEPSLSAAAHEAFDYERSLFDPARGWPVLEPDSDGGAAVSYGFDAWCRGAPGIALAQAAAVSGQAVVSDLEVALDITRDVPLGREDHLCCGNLGRIEVLLATGQLLGRQELMAAARSRAAAVLRRGGEGESARVLSPGFFRGAAGIGYTWLRLARPQLLPSILLFSSSAPRPAPADGDPAQPTALSSEISR